MRYLACAFIFFGWSLNALFGQAASQEVVNIISPKIFSLDSRGSGLFSREHSKVLEIELPENTQRWIIRFKATFTEKVAEDNVKNADLFKQVNLILSDTTKQINLGTELPDANNIGLYLLKDSLAAKDFTSWTLLDKSQYVPTYSTSESATDFFDIKDEKYLSGKLYIGMINQAVLDEAHVILEIVAVVDEPKSAKNNWKSSELDILQNDIKALCASVPDTILHPSRIDNVSLCVRQALESNWDAYTFSSLSEPEQTQWINLQLLKCLEKEKSVPVKDEMILDENLIYGQWISGDGEKLTFKSDGSIAILKKNGRTISGNWSFQNGILSLRFKGYLTQQYQSSSFSRKQIQWVNMKNSNILKLKKISL